MIVVRLKSVFSFYGKDGEGLSGAIGSARDC